jgi:hypothetical protein
MCSDGHARTLDVHFIGTVIALLAVAAFVGDAIIPQPKPRICHLNV